MLRKKKSGTPMTKNTPWATSKGSTRLVEILVAKDGSCGVVVVVVEEKRTRRTRASLAEWVMHRRENCVAKVAKVKSELDDDGLSESPW